MNLKSKITSLMPEGKTIKKAKKDKRKLPKNRKAGTKTKILIWICIFWMGFSGSFAYIKSMNSEKETQKNAKKIEVLSSDNEQKIPEKYLTPELERFTEEFIPIYMNVSNDATEFDERTKNLNEYYAEGMKELPEIPDGRRELQHISFYDKEFQNNYIVMKYKVDYINISVKQIEKKTKVKEGDNVVEKKELVPEETKTNVSSIINIPVTEKDGAFKIVENIYFSSVPNLQAKGVKTIENDALEKEEVDINTKTKAEKFLPDFFKKYAESKAGDMSYMMAEPCGLEGLKDFSELKDCHVYKEKDGTLLVKTTVVFTESTLNLTNEEHFTLKLTEKDSNYFVEEMNNTLGGTNK
ncbi:conjugal transfer protein [Listeria monocytogenes]